MAVDIRLAHTRVKKAVKENDEPQHLMTPGDVITTDSNFMRFEWDLTFLLVIPLRHQLLFLSQIKRGWAIIESGTFPKAKVSPPFKGRVLRF